jgi:hypothetical protein
MINFTFFTVKNGAKCGSNQFICEASSHCIPLIYRCDNQPNCEDGSDEFNCKGKSSRVMIVGSVCWNLLFKTIVQWKYYRFDNGKIIIILNMISIHTCSKQLFMSNDKEVIFTLMKNIA